MSAIIQVKGVSGIRRALRPLLDPQLTKVLDTGTKKAAQLYAKELRSGLRPVSKRMARSVRVRRARKPRIPTAWVVGSRRKLAFFWPFVIDGTKAHGPRRAKSLRWKSKDGSYHRASRVRGLRPNPVVERVARRAESRAFNEVDKQIKT